MVTDFNVISTMAGPLHNKQKKVHYRKHEGYVLLSEGIYEIAQFSSVRVFSLS